MRVILSTMTSLTVFTDSNPDILRGFKSEASGIVYLNLSFNSDHSTPIRIAAAGAAFWTLGY